MPEPERNKWIISPRLTIESQPIYSGDILPNKKYQGIGIRVFRYSDPLIYLFAKKSPQIPSRLYYNQNLV